MMILTCVISLVKKLRRQQAYERNKITQIEYKYIKKYIVLHAK